MNDAKLADLRRRFADAGALQIEDPVLKAAADDLAVGGRRTLPYAGIPTLLGLPHATDAAGLDVAAVGAGVGRDAFRTGFEGLNGSSNTRRLES